MTSDLKTHADSDLGNPESPQDEALAERENDSDSNVRADADTGIDAGAQAEAETDTGAEASAAKNLAAKAKRIWGSQKIRWIAYSAALTLALFVVTRFITDMPPFAVAFLLAIASAFAAIGYAHSFVMRKTHRQLLLHERGWQAKLIGGRMLTLIVSFALAVVFIGSLLLSMAKWGPIEWLVISCGPILLIPATFLGAKIAHHEYAETFRTNASVSLTSIVLCVMLTLIYVTVLLATPGFDAPPSAAQAVADAFEVFSGSPSALLCEMGKFCAVSDGMTAYMLGQASQESSWAFVIIKIIISLFAFIGYSSLLATLTMDKTDILRIFAPLDQVKEESRTPKAVGSWVVLAAILPLLLIAVFPFADGKFSKVVESESYTRAEQIAREAVGFMVVEIDGRFYDPAVIQALKDEATASYEQLTADVRERFTVAVNSMCDQQIANVDAYLDWYYSLPADYERLVGIFTGTIEEGMKDQIEQRLNEGVDTSELDTILNDFAAKSESIRAEYEQKFGECEVIDIPDWLVTKEASIATAADLFAPPQPTQQLLGAHERFIVSAGAGAAGGVLAKAAFEKVVKSEAFGKITQRLIAALGRSSAVKLGSTAVGTVIFPGAGTAVGTVVGIGVSVATDYLFLKADEAMNRDSYREQLIASIEESRAELLASVSEPTS